MDKEGIIEGVKDLLDKGQQDDRALMEQFFNLLFWRDYKDGYVNIKDKDNIFVKIKETGEIKHYGDDEYTINLNTDKILPFINKIRKQIGLLELDNTLYAGTLIERTPEVEKKLILKELEK